MTETNVEACVPVDISDDDVYEAMKDISGYLDITPGDFKEVYIKAYQHAVLRLTHSVKASHVMTTEVATVTTTTPIKEVAEIMAARGISGVPVLESDGTVVGIISEKDFLNAMGAGEARTFMEVVSQCLKGRACLAAPLRVKYAQDIMTSPAITVSGDTPIMEVAGIFTHRGINRVPVVDRDNRLVGIVSRADVVRSSFFGEDL